VFNPFFRGGIPLPATIAVFDAERKYVGTYLGPGRSRQNPGKHDWVYLQSGGYVGRTHSLVAGRVPNTPSASSSNPPLPPGKYYLQAIFNRGFVNFRSDVDLSKAGPAEIGETLIKLFDAYDRTEAFRSNVVEIELVE
jgi:hypothetical protein